MAARPTNWDISGVKLRATIDEIEVDVIRASLSFALNSIPQCSLTLALGRRVDTLKPAAIHQLIDKFTRQLPVKVYFKGTNLANFGGQNTWPADEFLIFEGVTAGPGYQRTTSAASFTIQVEHWLTHLTTASAIAAFSHPHNPASLILDAVFVSPAETAAGRGANRYMTSLSIASEAFSLANIRGDDAANTTGDFWGKAMQPFLIGLASQRNIAATHLGNISAPLKDLANEQSNPLAVAALKRMEPLPDGYNYGVPLELDVSEENLTQVVKQIVSQTSAETLEAMHGFTAWDKIVSYSDSFFYAIAPLVDTALIVPYTPGLRESWKTIGADEYVAAQIRGQSPNLIRGVGVYGSYAFNVQGASTKEGGNMPYDASGIGGGFLGSNTGLILLKRGPFWATGVFFPGFAKSSSGVAGVRATALQPDFGEDKIQPGEEDLPAELLKKNTAVLNRVAQSMYLREVLQHRSGQVTGKLRFDIAPGSTVLLEGAGEKFLGLDDQLGQPFYADVVAVQIDIDAETPNASTSFSLAHLRTVKENSDDATSVDNHPLWKTPWLGSPLV